MGIFEHGEVNSKELHAIEFIAALDNRLQVSEPDLEQRLRGIPDGWRQFRIAKAAVEKVLDGIYRTIPKKTLTHMDRILTFGEVVIRPKPATRSAEVQIVDEEALRHLINVAIAAECAICLRHGAECRACKLRKALMLIAPPAEIPADASCAYQTVAQHNELEHYI